jgi:hypothetical protein
MSESMIDRVKAAIAEKMVPAINAQAPYAKVMFEMAARAAIEAMREPTEAMGESADQYASMGMALKVWQAMIDAALK